MRAPDNLLGLDARAEEESANASNVCLGDCVLLLPASKRVLITVISNAPLSLAIEGRARGAAMSALGVLEGCWREGFREYMHAAWMSKLLVDVVVVGSARRAKCSRRGSRRDTI